MTKKEIKNKKLISEQGHFKSSTSKTSKVRSVILKDKLINRFKNLKDFFLKTSWKVRILILLFVIGLGFLTRGLIIKSSDEEVTYQTAAVEKGTLINSISASGTITSGNYTNVTTKVSGTVDSVYVTNGEKVVKGQKIAEVILDEYAKERQAAAWVSYLEAKENYLESINGKAEADIAMWNAREDVLSAQEALNDMNDNDTNPATHEVYTDGERMIITKTLDQTRKAFTVAEAKYSNADADIGNASAKVAAALRTYHENSSTIFSPAAGTLTDLALAEGIVVSASSSTSSTSGATIVSSQTVGKISDPDGQLIATVNLTEIDILKVKANQKVTLTLDAYEDKTFTGKVLAVNTSGNVSSGVTNYPVTILLDPVTVEIYPNMAINAEIITGIKTDVLMVPSSAVETNNEISSVQIIKDKNVSTVTVEIGSSNDSYIEIVSGVNVGDEVITATTIKSNSEKSSNTTTSPFSGIGRTQSSGTVIRSSGAIPMGPGF